MRKMPEIKLTNGKVTQIDGLDIAPSLKIASSLSTGSIKAGTWNAGDHFNATWKQVDRYRDIVCFWTDVRLSRGSNLPHNMLIIGDTVWVAIPYYEEGTHESIPSYSTIYVQLLCVQGGTISSSDENGYSCEINYKYLPLK